MKNLWDLYNNILVPAQAVLMRMESGGIRVDCAALAVAKKDARRRKKAASSRVIELANEVHSRKLLTLQSHLEVLDAERAQCKAVRGDTKELTKLINLQRRELDKHGETFRVTNLNAWRWLLFQELMLRPPPRSTTKKGNQKLGKDELKWMIQHNADVEVLRYAGEIQWCSKRLSTEYKIKIDREGYTHPSYSLHRTSTKRVASGSDFSDTGKGRSSDSGNLQNIPEECRSIYVPDGLSDWFVSADWSQVQAKIAAFLAGEWGMYELIEKGDIHTHNARILAEAIGIKPPQDKEEAEATLFPGSKHSLRKLAKPLSYGWVFGMGPFKMQELYGISKKDALLIDQAARQAYPNIVRWWGRIRGQLERGEVLTNPWGLPSYYYNSYKGATKWAKEADFREAMGWIVQSSEAMMCLTILPLLEGLTISAGGQQTNHTLSPSTNLRTGSSARLVTTTHDSFLLSSPDPTLLAPAVKEVMERPWEEMTMPTFTKIGVESTRGIPAPAEQLKGFWAAADLKVGKNWGPAKPCEDHKVPTEDCKKCVNPQGLWGLKG